MATWASQTRNTASFSNQTRNSAVFAGISKSDGGAVFGDLTFDQIGAETFDGIFRGRPVGEWHFDDPISGTYWSNQTRNV